jgi:hypothetical protein
MTSLIRVGRAPDISKAMLRDQVSMGSLRPISVCLAALAALVVVIGCAGSSGASTVTNGSPSRIEQAVIIHIPPGPGPSELDPIESSIKGAIDHAKVGEFDGDEFGSDGATLYMYGPDADRLFEAIQPVLTRTPLPSGSYVIKRYGPPGSRETRVAQ